jgi:hypothetical protein
MGHYVSFVIQSWYDEADDAMRWQVRCVDDREPPRLPDGSFVVRTWVDHDKVIRGLVRHVQSGREMQFQSSKRALDFVRAWMDDDATLWLDCQEDALLDIGFPGEGAGREVLPDA